MSFPQSDHCNGTRFFNPEPPIQSQKRRSHSLLRLLGANLSRDPSGWATWPKHVENNAYPPPDGETPSLTWIGHSSFLLCLGGMNILTDPIFSQRCSPIGFIGPKRVRDPGLKVATLPRIDLILLSHNHYDHLDVPSLHQICRRFPEADIITSLGNARFLARKKLYRATELDWWQSVTIRDTTITATPARHFSARTLWDRNKTLWAGFMLTHAGRTLYFAGDSGYSRGFSQIYERLGPPDLAMLPIGAYQPRELMATVHMDPLEAVQAFRDLHAKRAVGMHFGTFQLTGEPMDEPPQRLHNALTSAGLTAEQFFVLDAGQSVGL